MNLASQVAADDSACDPEQRQVEVPALHFSGLSGEDGMDTGATVQQLPLSRQEWLADLETASNMAAMGTRLAWGLARGFFPELTDCAGPARLPARPRRSGELFPLPVMLPKEEDIVGDEARAGRNLKVAVQSWLALACSATNRLYQCEHSGRARKPGKVHVRLLEDMGCKIERFLEGDSDFDGSFSQIVEDLKSKRVSYTGEEIAQPFPLSREQIEKSLPPRGHGGSIPVTTFLKGRTKYLMENPLESLLEPSERGSSPVTARVHSKRGEELGVFGLFGGAWNHNMGP